MNEGLVAHKKNTIEYESELLTIFAGKEHKQQAPWKLSWKVNLVRLIKIFGSLNIYFMKNTIWG